MAKVDTVVGKVPTKCTSRYLTCTNAFSARNGVERKIRTYLDLLSIPRLWGENVKTFRFDATGTASYLDY